MKDKGGTDWLPATVVAGIFLVALGMVFFYAPREITMGDVQRIFYFHVASAWVGFFGFFVTFMGGGLYLLRGERFWDILALASAEVGLTFITMTLLTGMLWAKPVWGVYWTWEPRLTISAVQWVIYLAYAVLRGSVSAADRGARFAAVYGVVAFVTVPLSWFAIRWWRTIHPVVFSSSGMTITPKMLTTLLVSIAAFTGLYGVLLRARIHLEQDRDRLATLRRVVEWED
ncbi:MAG: cytochrome c biogenesis protein CcsA [Anaerolineae bacterium]|nr:cytochrome c biogenesis protein CcsA [Anaerolineae bacterium]